MSQCRSMEQLERTNWPEGPPSKLVGSLLSSAKKTQVQTFRIDCARFADELVISARVTYTSSFADPPQRHELYATAGG
jgi:hypothetical protein